MKFPLSSTAKVVFTTLVPLSLIYNSAWAVSFPVTTNADSGAGSFRDAIDSVNAGGGADTIDFNNGLGTILLLSDLSPILQPTTINGPAMGGQVIDGNSAFPIFYVPSSVGTITVNGNSGITIMQAQARGGNGGAFDPTFESGTGGGAGAGAGSGLMVHNGNTFITTGVSYVSGQALGGSGGNGGVSTGVQLEYAGGGGGGFCGGDGGDEGSDSPTVNGGGGGGGDSRGLAGHAGNGTSDGAGGEGGVPGIGGVADVGGSGGGGGGGNAVDGGNGVASATTGAGGAGGGTGGGGGASLGAAVGGTGGAGAFGGGGGGGGGRLGGVPQNSGNGGAGGFGGGGGGVCSGTAVNGTPGAGGFGGGSGGAAGTVGMVTASGGGGAAGFGGGVFVRNGATVTLADSMSVPISFSNTATAGTGGTGAGMGAGTGGSGIAAGQDVFLMTGGLLTFNLINNSAIACIESDNGAGGGVGGSVTKLGVGRLTIETGTTANVYTGPYIVTAGALQGNTTTLAGPITDNGDVTFNQTVPGVFTLAITGTGTLSKIGASTLTFPNAKTYDGGTTISAGSLIVTGSIVGPVTLDTAGAIFNVQNTFTIGDLNSVVGTQVTISSPNILTVTTSMADLVAGTIIGLGGLTVTGSDTLTLSGTNTYSGGTIINGGTLEVTGSIPGPVNVNMAGATFDVGNSFSINQLSAVVGSFVNLQLGDTLTITTSAPNVINGVIQGLGALTVAGTSSVTASATNTYAGGTTITGTSTYIVTGSITGPVSLATSGTTFDVQNTFTIGNLNSVIGSTVNIGTGEVLTVTTTMADLVAGIITGGGGLTVTGVSTLTLSGTNAYTGGTIINGGTLEVTGIILSPVNVNMAGATFDVGNSFVLTDLSAVAGSFVNLQMGDTLTLQPSMPLTINGVIQGSGELRIEGTSSVTVTAANTYTGGTTITDSSSYIVTGSITGPVTLISSGTTFDVQNTFTIGDLDSVSGSIVNINGGDILTVTTSEADLVAGVIQGLGGLTVAGSGVLTVSNTNTYTGGTTVSGGTYRVLGSIVGPVNVNMAGATFDVSNTFTIGDLNSVAGGIVNIGTGRTLTVTTSMADTANGVIQGAGALTITGTNTLTAGGVNTYTGGTTIAGGTYQVTGSIVGDVNIPTAGATFDVQNTFTIGNLTGVVGSIVNIGAGDVLTVVPSAPSTFPGTIQGAGGFTLAGSTSLNLTAINTHSGPTTVQSGTLFVNGTFTNSVTTVNAGATLAGTGSLRTVTNNGTVSPGNSIGTLTIVGNYTQNSGSTYDVEVTPTTTDLLDITGTATINPGSTLRVTPGPGNYPVGTSLTILQAASVTGTFSTFLNLDPRIGFLVVYDPADVRLVIVSFMNFVDIVGGRGGRTVSDIAACFDNASAPSGSDLAEVILALASFGLDTDALVDAFKQMEPKIYGALALAQQNNTERLRNTISHRLQNFHVQTCRNVVQEEDDDEEDETTLYPEPKNQLWVEPFGDFASQNHTPNQRGYHANSFGLATGYDYEFVHNLYAGGMIGYSNTHLKWSKQAGHGDLNSLYGGVYGLWSNQIFRIDVALLAGWTHYETTRKIQFSTIDRKAENHHGGYEINPSIGFEYDIKRTNNHIVPFARFDYVFLHQSGFKEHNAKSLNLKVQSKSYDMLRSEVGLSWYMCIQRQDVKYIPEAKLSYINEARLNNRSLEASFFDELSCSFTSNILNPQRNMIAPGFGLTIDFTEIDFDFAIRYEAEIDPSNYWDQEASIHMTKKF